MVIKMYFHVGRFQSLIDRENFLIKADTETRSYIEKELARCTYASNQGEQLKKVALLIGKYSDRELSTEDIADLILWNCVDIFSIDN
jgi:hypothetical protein